MTASLAVAHDFDAFRTFPSAKRSHASAFSHDGFRDTQRATLQDVRDATITTTLPTTTAMDKEADHNFRSSPRADSFVDFFSNQDAMDIDVSSNVDDDAIIKCICGFGKGFDDDDAIICDRCSTWQHTLCYFHREPLPADDQQYLCVECKPRPDVDVDAAAQRMQKKVQTLSMLADRISELSYELLTREEELHALEAEIAFVEADLDFKAPVLESDASPDAWELLDEWRYEHQCLQYDIAKTMHERDAIRIRLQELEDDANRVKRNELTKAEELNARWADQLAGPRLWTTACSLGGRAAVPHAMPPVLMLGGGKGKAAKKKKRKSVR